MKIFNHLSFNSKIVFIAAVNIIFYYVSHMVLLKPTIFVHVTMCILIGLIISNAVFRFLCVKGYKRNKSKNPDSFLDFFDYCFDNSKISKYNQYINVFVNCVLIIGWFHFLFVKLLLPIFIFLSTQINF